MHKTSKHEQPIAAAGGVVYRQAAAGHIEILLIKKQGGFWTLPKGRIKAGEEVRAAVAREVAEETSITGDVEAMVRQVLYTIQKGSRHRPKVVSYYLLHARDGQARPPAQTKEQIAYVRWFPVRAALRRIRRSRIRAVVRDARAMIGISGAQAENDT